MSSEEDQAYELSQEKTVEYVRNSAANLLSTFNGKLELLRGNKEVTEKILRQGFDPKVCFEEAIKFFGSEDVRYLAIDGTEAQEDKLDMLIFYAGAFGYGGSIHFNEEGGVTASPPSASHDSVNLSSAIPISEDYASVIASEETESGAETDADRVPQALMHFAEYYLAYTEIMKDESIRVLLMDRSVSGDIAHISWKMRDLIRDGKNCLENLSTDLGRVTRLDLELGRMLIENADLSLPPPRSQYLKYAAMQKLIENGPMTAAELIEKLGANTGRTTKLFKELTDPKILGQTLVLRTSSEDSPLEVEQSVKNYFERLLEAVSIVARNIFHPARESHPLKLKRQDGSEKWITADDLDYLTLISIYALLKEAWKRNILILGVVKDTAAGELVKTVLPILQKAELVNFSSEIPLFESDKMLLQTNSVVNSRSIKTPWRTFEYDVCFRTISPNTDDKSKPSKGVWPVRGAFKNVITSERMFVKAYFQLWSSENDSSVRSHVFLYDRPCYPQYDLPKSRGSQELLLTHFDDVREEIIPAIHFLEKSPISDLVLGILYSMGTEPIPEAIGHNYPLFLADKKAKLVQEESMKASLAAVELELTRSKLDQQILYESKFRNYRGNVESRRKSANRKK